MNPSLFEEYSTFLEHCNCRLAYHIVFTKFGVDLSKPTMYRGGGVFIVVDKRTHPQNYAKYGMYKIGRI